MKSGFVAIVGKPNVGKSTLLNMILREKVSIVSHKPQTTRFNILGILTLEDAQIIFIDTPGIMKKAKNVLDKSLLKEAFSSLQDADVIVMVVEPTYPTEEDLKVLEAVKQSGKPSILVINKIDTVRDKKELLPIMEHYSKLHDFKEFVPISALYQDGIDILLDVIKKYLPEGEFYFPEDQITDKPLRVIVAEIIREKIYQLYHEEIPYATAVHVEEFIDPEEHPEENRKKVYIRAIIYVERESQKPIIIGEGGRKIKQLGMAARKDIEALLGKPVFLELHVKVKPKWRRNEGFIRSLNRI